MQTDASYNTFEWVKMQIRNANWSLKCEIKGQNANMTCKMQQITLKCRS